MCNLAKQNYSDPDLHPVTPSFLLFPSLQHCLRPSHQTSVDQKHTSYFSDLQG